jgi:hypothetical protein
MMKQVTKIALVLVMVTVLMESRSDAQDIQAPASPMGNFTGVESVTADCVFLFEMCHGDTFVLASHREWDSYHLTVSLDYSTAQFVPNNFIVTRGSWSLVIFRNNEYAGTLYGTIRSGTVNVILDREGAAISK